ncbi:uncharacterized protein LOC142503195 [Ascaphus truei]|uniref:uncharacterized protein LOC142503195 n=1 Tax=Ascaphus truei TaxID=8439 RepID=UPI003F5AA19F
MILLMLLLGFISTASQTRSLWTDKDMISAKEGEEITIKCFYDSSRFIFYNKYWCFGESWLYCKELCNTETRECSERLNVKDYQRGIFYVTMRYIVLEDSGKYWCAIKKNNADMRSPLLLNVTEDPISVPLISATNNPLDSCSGLPVTIMCSSATGFQLQYSWYREDGTAVAHSNILQIQCEALTQTQDQEYYCEVSNRRHKKSSGTVKAVLLNPTEKGCVYLLLLPDHKSYSCIQTTVATTAMHDPTTFAHQTECNNLSTSFPVNSRHTISVLWAMLRWVLPIIEAVTLIAVHMYVCCKKRK